MSHKLPEGCPRHTPWGATQHGEAISKYFTLLAIGWCMNTGLVWFLAHEQGWNYWLAQILATGIGLAWNFAGSRWWAFKPAE